jgi:hypothetical protein
MYTDPAGAKLMFPEGTPIQVLFTDHNDFSSPQDWLFVKWKGSDGKDYYGYVPANRIKRIPGIKPITAAESELTKQAGLSPLPTPLPGHEISDDQGHKINLLGQEWTQTERALLKKDLNG